MQAQSRPAGVAYGECWCGCGGKTKPAVSNLEGRGLVKGEPQRFILGHHRKGSVREVDRGYTTPCHIGPWSTVGQGYCKISRGGEHDLAHRYFYKQAHGAIPDGLELDHLCHQRDCVNPEHLEPVTHDENQRRRIDGKLSKADVVAIRASLEPQSKIAARFAINQGYVSQIRSGKRRLKG